MTSLVLAHGSYDCHDSRLVTSLVLAHGSHDCHDSRLVTSLVLAHGSHDCHDSRLVTSLVLAHGSYDCHDSRLVTSLVLASDPYDNSRTHTGHDLSKVNWWYTLTQYKQTQDKATLAPCRALHNSCTHNCHLGWCTPFLKCNKNNYDWLDNIQWWYTCRPTLPACRARHNSCIHIWIIYTDADTGQSHASCMQPWWGRLHQSSPVELLFAGESSTSPIVRAAHLVVRAEQLGLRSKRLHRHLRCAWVRASAFGVQEVLKLLFYVQTQHNTGNFSLYSWDHVATSHEYSCACDSSPQKFHDKEDIKEQTLMLFMSQSVIIVFITSAPSQMRMLFMNHYQCMPWW